MRDVKFRGKRLDNGEWIHGYLIQSLPYQDGSVRAWIKKRSLLPPTTIYHSISFFDEVDPGTVGQYTGPKDRNGVEIYEGDVYRYEGREVANGKQIFPIRTKTIENFIRDTNTMLNIFECSSRNSIEVIGNIHDNPELLEGGR